MINAAACNAHNGSSCGQAWATVFVGDSPAGRCSRSGHRHDLYGERVQRREHGLGDRRANLQRRRHLGVRPDAGEDDRGDGAFAVAVNPATETIYVANRNDNTVSVIDGRACNGSHTAGCGQDWPTLAVGTSPQALAVNKATNTIYVTNTNDDTVSVIDGSTCNGSDHSGCGQTPPTVAVGAGPRAVGVNQVTDTIYVGNRFDGTVSVVDGRSCNGIGSSGCAQTPPAVAIGSPPARAALAVGRAWPSIGPLTPSTSRASSTRT